MYFIEVLLEEHENILRFNRVVRKICLGIMAGNEIKIADFRNIIDFVRNYADRYHHDKEEKFLFIEMQNRLGDIAVNVIKHGMLVEHDLGRLYITELENALDSYEKKGGQESKLDVVTNATAYTHLLQRHINKENDVVFNFAEKNLSKDVIFSLNLKTREYEESSEKKITKTKYLNLLQELENKYL